MRRLFSVLVALLVVLSSVLAAGPAPQPIAAQSMTPQGVQPRAVRPQAEFECGGSLPADADATVMENYPANNFGGLDHLLVARGGVDGLTSALLHFPSPEVLIASDSVLESAELELVMYSTKGANPFTVQPADLSEAWEEMTVSWGKLPALQGQMDERAYL